MKVKCKKCKKFKECRSDVFKKRYVNKYICRSCRKPVNSSNTKSIQKDLQSIINIFKTQDLSSENIQNMFLSKIKNVMEKYQIYNYYFNINTNTKKIDSISILIPLFGEYKINVKT